MADYVGADGAVVLFMNDWDDNLPMSTSGDPSHDLTSELIANAIAVAVASGHGYVGEFNGGAMGLAANSNFLAPLSFFDGTAGPLGSFACQDVTMTHAGAVMTASQPSRPEISSATRNLIQPRPNARTRLGAMLFEAAAQEWLSGQTQGFCNRVISARSDGLAPAQTTHQNLNTW